MKFLTTAYLTILAAMMFSTDSRSDECDLSTVSGYADECTLTPTGYQVIVYALGLCETAPTLPTASTVLDYSNCELVFDKIGTDGVLVELAGVGYSTALETDFELPPPGNYRYIIVGLGQGIGIKRSLEFPEAVTAMDGTTGKYCATAYSETQTNWSTCNASTPPDPEYSIDIIEKFDVDGVKTFRKDFANNLTGYAMKDDYTMSSDNSETEWLLGYQTLSSPLTVTPETSSVDLGFIVTNGMGMYDDNGSGAGYVINVYPREFSFTVSAQ